MAAPAVRRQGASSRDKSATGRAPQVVEVNILGPVEFIVAGQPVPVPPRERAIITVLSLSVGQSVGLHELCTTIWAEPLPASARKTVQVNVSRLRQRIDALRRSGRAAAIIETTADGYRLAAEGDAVDAVRFARMAEDGVTALEAADFETASGLLTSALDLWRGDALADLADTVTGQVEIARLEELRLTTREAANDAELALGHHERLIGSIEDQIAATPLRERLWRQLMVALYRSGRQADALRAFQRVRSLLVDALGIEPCRELRQLEGQILAQDTTLDLPDGSGEASAKPSRAPKPGGDSGARAWADRLCIGAFVGRAQEMRRLDAAVEAAERGLSVAVITGPEGIGKTRLLAETVRRCSKANRLVLVATATSLDATGEGTTLGRALDRWVRNAEVDPASLNPRAAAALAVLSPLLADRLGLSSPGETARVPALAEALIELARITNTGASPALFIDEAHLVDPTTLATLRELVEAHGDVPLLVVLVVGADVDRREVTGLLLAAHRLPGACSIEVGALDVDEGARLLADRLGQPDDDEGQLARASLSRDAAGVPRHLIDLAEHLAVGSHPDRPISIGVDVGIPAPIRAEVGRRKAVLPADAVELLEVAAVIGAVFDPGTVAEVADRPRADVDALLERAEEVGLVRTSRNEQPRFASALIQRALYDDMAGARRSTLHRATGEHLAQAADANVDEGLAEIADQFAQAGLGSTTGNGALEQAYLAAYLDAVQEVRDVTAGAGSPAVAPDRRRWQLLCDLAASRARHGDERAAFGLYLRAAEEARDLGLVEDFVRTAVAAARIVVAIGVFHPPIVKLLREAGAALDPADPLQDEVNAVLLPELVWARDWEGAMALGMTINGAAEAPTLVTG